MTKNERVVVAACADAMFPPAGPIPVSGTEAGLVAYFGAYCQRLPLKQRTLIRLLLLFIQLSPLVFGPRFTLYTGLKQDDRISALERMEKHRWQFLRGVFQSLRFILTNGYFACPKAERTITRRERGEVRS